MTICFVRQFGPICIAAADTRISGGAPGGLPASVWDMADLPIADTAGNRLLVPYRFRKIRQVDRGWAVCAGSYLTGNRMLDVLNREKAFTASRVTEVLQVFTETELASLNAIPGVSGELLFPSTILGVSPAVDDGGVWYAELNDSRGYSVTGNVGFAINWPSSIPLSSRFDAEQNFSRAQSSFTHMGDLVRGAAVLIGSGRSAPDCSPVVQIGVSWMVSATNYQVRYIQGTVDEIFAMTNQQIEEHWECLQSC